MSRTALEGIRVIAISQYLAGPWATEMLAALGAQVIKVESTRYIDGWRNYTLQPGDRFWERSARFNAANRAKYGITLHLADPRGKELFKKLVKVSDVVMENYPRRVMMNLGLDYPALKEVNPSIIMVSATGLGRTGPWRDYASYAWTVDSISGLSQLTGYPDGPPTLIPDAMCDAVPASYAALATLLALHYRRRTGLGQHIDLSDCESLMCCLGEPFTDYTLNKRVKARQASHHPSMAPHSVYRCKGEDEWVAIAMSSDEEWAKFCEVVGNRQWAKDEKFSDLVSRHRNQGELDRLIEGWTINMDKYQAMDTLQKAGVPAGVVLKATQLLDDPHLRARGYWQWCDAHPVVDGTHPYPELAIRLSKTPSSLARPAPILGQHNDFILAEILGITKEELAQLGKDNIIGKEPYEYRRRSYV